MTIKNDDKKLITKLLRQSDLKTFERLYNRHYEDLCIYALKYTSNRSLIEDIVQDTFIDFWSSRKKINITTTLRGYLFRMVYYKLIDSFKHNTKEQDAYLSYYQDSIDSFASSIENDSDYKTELLERLNLCIDKLPKRCKRIFIEAKITGFKNKQIAQKVNISIKTVEGHIRRAYGFLKNCMDEFPSVYS